jgi:hypothetical protein
MTAAMNCDTKYRKPEKYKPPPSDVTLLSSQSLAHAVGLLYHQPKQNIAPPSRPPALKPNRMPHVVLEDERTNIIMLWRSKMLETAFCQFVSQ